MRLARSIAAISLLGSIALVSCAPPPPLTDAQRVWCANNPIATIGSGARLGLRPSRFVQHAADVEQAVVEGDWGKAQALVVEWNAQQAAATESDPHPGMGSMLAWETDAPEDFRLACLEAIRRS